MRFSDAIHHGLTHTLPFFYRFCHCKSFAVCFRVPFSFSLEDSSAKLIREPLYEQNRLYVPVGIFVSLGNSLWLSNGFFVPHGDTNAQRAHFPLFEPNGHYISQR